MKRRLIFSIMLATVALVAQAPCQTKTSHILFSSNSHGYIDPCG